MDMNKELKDVKDQAEIVRTLIEQALEKIDSARNWGLYDIFAGGMISSMVKRGRMKESNQLMEEIELALQRLQKEYGDINLELPEQLNLDFASEMFDVWFDNIFTDLSVQSNLKKRREQLVYLYDQVDELDKLITIELNK
ncbi:hypothetical protein ACTQ5J_00200 [Fundicoccus sp. Sow4_F4]|uniref:hypothetical protein n=1 Tax=Fundicoccus sp. Sow4_F4 TaxID=3438783 RepID=UPI003F92685C